MKPFTIPAWRKKHIKSKFQRQDKVAERAVNDMEAVMRTAVNYILNNWTGTDRMAEPSLNEMYAVSDHFYRQVITEAYHSAKEEKKDAEGKKKLEAGLPKGLPSSLPDLEKFFRDSRYWPKVLKRSKKITDRLRKAYLQKLRRKFNEVVPKLQSGEITVEEAKTSMMESWGASKGRVRTIFQTETTNYFSKTQVAFFGKDENIIGFMFDSIADSSRTPICRSRHGLIYRPGTELLRKNSPSCHFGCRSHLIALANTEHNRKLLEDPDRDPSKRSVVPLPRGWRT